jgi:hypothetical protein
MTEEEVVVNNEEANLDPNQVEIEQTEEQVEALSQPVDGKDYKAIAEQLSKDIREKNIKIQEQKALLANASKIVNNEVEQPVISEDDTVKRFLATEANATIAVKLQTDPSFKDRVEIVQSYVAQGYDINMADKLAKADIMDKILNESSTPTPVNIPKQIQPTAIPEQPKPQTDGSLDDIQAGKVEVKLDGISSSELSEVLARYRV